MALASGTRLGPYEILSALGAGGMGEVYRARDTTLNRDVALKVLPPEFMSNSDRVACFEREARLLASLNHPHIGSIYGVELSGTTPALVLELVEGDGLDARVCRGPLALPEALAIAQQIADALDAAHTAGIVHRDLKPSNIKISRDGSVKVLDFGLAKAFELQGNIWAIPALGGVPRRVCQQCGRCRRQPDGWQARALQTGLKRDRVSRRDNGRQMDAFQRGDSVRFDVFVAPATGGEPRQVTRDNNMMSGFAWLPDSTGIIYSSSRGRTMPYLPALGLWLVTLRDGNVRRITSGESSYVTPDVSRNGAIAVSRMRLQTDIWKFPVDGSPAENVRQGVRVTRQTGQVLTPTAKPPRPRSRVSLRQRRPRQPVGREHRERPVAQGTHERDPSVAMGVPVWSPDGRAIAFVSSRGNQGLSFESGLVDPDGSNLRNVANPGLGPAWSPDSRWVYYSTRGGAAATDAVLKKLPVDGGAAVTVTTERLRNAIGLYGTTLYYSFERPLMDGTPEFEIRAATPENAPFRVLARIPASRVPIWQIVNPALSPDGKWLAQALTDGLTTNVWALSTATGEWRQITDFGDRTTFIARRVSWSADGRSILPQSETAIPTSWCSKG